MRKWFDKRPLLKWSLVAVLTVLWIIGLNDQLNQPDALIRAAQYAGISLLMLAVMVI